jgi:hypothetical protein
MAKINGVPYALQGQTKPFTDTLETIFDFEIKDLDLSYYLPYVPMQMKLKIPSAFLDVKDKITFIQQKGKSPSANMSGDLALKKIVLIEGERLFIIEPKSLSPEKRDKIKDSRVDFKLK